MPIKNLFFAILMNVFVFPGAGHFYLKEKRRGVLFGVVAVIFVGVFLFQFYLATQMTAQNMAQSDLPRDVSTLTFELMNRLKNEHHQLFSRFTRYLGILMLVGCVDLFAIFLQRKSK